jgi:hypothetical protein
MRKDRVLETWNKFFRLAEQEDPNEPGLAWTLMLIAAAEEMAEVVAGHAPREEIGPELFAILAKYGMGWKQR